MNEIAVFDLNILRNDLMKRKLLTGVLVVVGIAVTVLNPVISGLLAIGIWIYLVRMVQKQKNSESTDQVVSGISGRQLKRLKELLIVAGFLFLVFIASAIFHNILHDLSDIGGSIYFFVALAALFLFIAANAGGMVIFLKARQKSI